MAERDFSMSEGLVASTVTPGRTPPDESFTTPASDACAYAEAGRVRNQDSTINPRVKRCMRSPFVVETYRFDLADIRLRYLSDSKAPIQTMHVNPLWTIFRRG